ncbi:MAG: DNA-processing protein DprA [Eubacteriaceae bacterium]|uniref:DNA-processing protein DprA n=1 Tax=Candidatus Pseudoramibacter fermentans TaxID=2594427 RepID=A0A6L5GRN4_9FIRM|nr:DNA-processing protein DprA [Candidatus Pseudoramibacter fermentans]RRF93742.1 MAG: DNA-processing protein DprA [Eubacteriaceae bacterium]
MNNLEIGLLAISCLKGFGQQRLNRLVKTANKHIQQHQFLNHELNYFDLIQIGIESNQFTGMLPISFFMEGYRKAEKIVEQCEKENVSIITPFSKLFPRRLKMNNYFEKDMGEYPVILYYLGDLSVLNQKKCAAVIGTRHPTEIGYQSNMEIAEKLAEKNVTIVSGLAIGCDQAAHLGCLNVGGKTAAFLPSPVNEVLPISNRKLAERIVEAGGCLLSEYPPSDKDFLVQNYCYVQRDRLQAMASDAVITSEFDRNSGTVHTLRYAQKYHKPIYALKEIAQSEQFALDFLHNEKIDIQLFSEPKQLENELEKIK